MSGVPYSYSRERPTFQPSRNSYVVVRQRTTPPSRPAINTINHDKVVVFGGGIPIKDGDIVISAIGASGGTVDQDVKVATAAVAAFAKS